MRHWEDKIIDGFDRKTFGRQLSEGRFSLVYSGKFSEEVIALYLMSLKRLTENPVITRKVYSLMIEVTQNVRYYSAERAYASGDEPDVGVGAVGFGRTPKHFLVTTGNYVDAASVERIRERCRQVNTVAGDRQALREFYRKTRNNPRPRRSSGAYLGFVDMVRRSGNPIEYEFRECPPDSPWPAFYVLKLKISRQQRLPGHHGHLSERQEKEI